MKRIPKHNYHSIKLQRVRFLIYLVIKRTLLLGASDLPGTRHHLSSACENEYTMVGETSSKIHPWYQEHVVQSMIVLNLSQAKDCYILFFSFLTLLANTQLASHIPSPLMRLSVWSPAFSFNAHWL